MIEPPQWKESKEKAKDTNYTLLVNRKCKQEMVNTIKYINDWTEDLKYTPPLLEYVKKERDIVKECNQLNQA